MTLTQYLLGNLESEGVKVTKCCKVVAFEEVQEIAIAGSIKDVDQVKLKAILAQSKCDHFLSTGDDTLE
jgi:hypothetical protein